MTSYEIKNYISHCLWGSCHSCYRVLLLYYAKGCYYASGCYYYVQGAAIMRQGASLAIIRMLWANNLGAQKAIQEVIELLPIL